MDGGIEWIGTEGTTKTRRERRREGGRGEEEEHHAFSESLYAIPGS